MTTLPSVAQIDKVAADCLLRALGVVCGLIGPYPWLGVPAFPAMLSSPPLPVTSRVPVIAFPQGAR